MQPPLGLSLKLLINCDNEISIYYLQELASVPWISPQHELQKRLSHSTQMYEEELQSLLRFFCLRRGFVFE